MLVIWFATVVLAITVAGLIRAEFRADKKQIYTFKPISSTLLLLIGIVPVLIGRDLSVNYSLWIVVGLLFSLGGDIALMFHDSPKAFRIGLVLFLMAHLMYCVAFSWQANMVRQEIQVIIILGILAAVVYRYLYPGLGSLKFSVLVYIIVISYMLNRAFATRLSPNFSRLQSGLVCVGAGLFYISDLMLAINRFRLPFRYHRISLAFYYGGQLLIALSTIT
jgi:uncharacterized membrane protein YhhN